MTFVREKKVSRKHIGRGILNTIIDNLPFEIHAPSYSFCGPGTKLAKRLARNDQPKNLLDSYCRDHDISYSLFRDESSRTIADRELAAKALQRFHSTDASLGEKIVALGVAGAMKAKTALGMGMKNEKQRKRQPRKKTNQIKGAALKTKQTKRKRQRVVPIAKRGGLLPLLLPILGALGALGGGAAGIAKAVQDSKANQQELAEQKRHNLAMEQATKGKGLYLKPYKGFGSRSNKGKGMYLAPFQKKKSS